MLVLTRKLMERLYIGDDICVTVVRLESGQVRLGIDAPRDISVVRAELVPHREPPAPLHGRQDDPMATGRPNFRRQPCEARGTGSRPRGRSR